MTDLSPDGAASDPARPSSLTERIAQALSQIYTEFAGRTPTSTRASIDDDVVVVIMSDAATKAERRLITMGRVAPVLEMRREIQRAIQPAFSAAVERLTGRQVLAYMSDSHLDPDLASKVFLLDGPVVEGGDWQPQAA